ncbi:MAG: hypothetical protein WA941_08985 [Nitrososphaeraceae archaeon]
MNFTTRAETVREIAKEVRMSFRDIGAVTRNANEEHDTGSIGYLLKRDNMSKDSQALELFLQGRNRSKLPSF